jgi:hypothetical protein
MRVNTNQSIKTANSVYARFGSWRAAKESSSFEGGKYIVRSASADRGEDTPGTK